MLTRLGSLLLVLLGTGSALAQLTVVASIRPYGDLIEQLGGELVEVVIMLPPGGSPHTFEPSPRLVSRLADADLVVFNGGLDDWLLDLVEAANAEVPIVEALAVLGRTLEDHADERDVGGDEAHEADHADDQDEGHDDDHADDQEDDQENVSGEAGHDHLGVNPHVWLDPTLVAELVGAIAEELEALDPSNAAVYRARASSLVSELASLDAELEALLHEVAGAPFIPFHDAWPYFARRYELDLILEIEPFPGREPSPRYLAEVVAAIRNSGAPAIFSEVGLNDRPASVLAGEAGVSLHLLDPLGTPGERYQDLLRRNARTVVAALLPWTR